MFVMTCFAWPASAQETLRIRGTIESVDGSVYVIKNRDGAEVKLTVIDPKLYVAIVKAIDGRHQAWPVRRLRPA